ncbi:MAG: LysM peptidoglycan-binding domain-containing protein, partial [Bacteroidales bacterium]
SDFLKTTSRYTFLFELDQVDYSGWARGLKKAGYATNPDYSEMLIKKIEEYSLYEYDRVALSGMPGKQTTRNINGLPAGSNMEKEPVKRTGRDNSYVMRESSPGRIVENNRIKYIIVSETDTRESIEKELKLLRWELSRYNELPDDFEPEQGQILYIQPKRKKAEAGRETHTVQEGETMYMISQKYGIRMKYLYYYNRMSEGSEPETGQKIWLRRLKPVY